MKLEHPGGPQPPAGRVPPVLQAASLKRGHTGGFYPRAYLTRSACIAGGLIEAAGVPSASHSPQSRSACIAGGLIEAAGPFGPVILAERVPPVLQAASLKRTCRSTLPTAGRVAFRLYCRRPH